MIRVVVDTNVLVSALSTKIPSLSLHIYNLIKSEDFLLILSPALLEELEEVMSRERIAKLHKRTTKQIQQMLDEIAETSLIVLGQSKIQLVRDPDDNKIIAAALEGKADFIISRDKDLLDLKEYQGIKIVSPEVFSQLLRKGI